MLFHLMLEINISLLQSSKGAEPAVQVFFLNHRALVTIYNQKAFDSVRWMVLFYIMDGIILAYPILCYTVLYWKQ